MKTVLVFFSLLPSLVALDITTLDGKTYQNCQVSKVYPDSICVLFSGSGARIKFTNLPEPLRAQYGYDSERAAAFEQAEAARIQREQALLAAQRQQSAAQRRSSPPAETNQPPQSPSPGIGNGSESARATAAYGGGYGGGGYGNRGGYNQGGNQFGNQSGYTGAEYVGVRLAPVGGGGIRGVTIPTPTQARPPGTVFP